MIKPVKVKDLQRLVKALKDAEKTKQLYIDMAESLNNYYDLLYKEGGQDG